MWVRSSLDVESREASLRDLRFRACRSVDRLLLPPRARENDATIEREFHIPIQL